MTRETAGLVLRRAGPADAARMLAIGVASDRLFADHGFPQIPELPPTPLPAFRDVVASRDAWIALFDGVPAGFAVAGKVAGEYWLKELAVDPAFGRRGIGGTLLSAVVDHARSAGHRTVALSTFRDVPFNRPFYARRGFVDIGPESASAEMRQQFLREVPPGIDPSTRILMLRAL